jgi:hypothetical protein
MLTIAYILGGREVRKMETGSFTLQGNGFVAGDRKYCLKRRKEPAGSKPLHYIIQVDPFRYISSLFPKPGERDTFTLDFEGRVYILRKAEAEQVVEIAELE